MLAASSILAACSGGHSSSMLPQSSNTASNPAPNRVSAQSVRVGKPQIFILAII